VAGSAWTEANIGQKYRMNGRDHEDRSDDLLWFVEGGAAYIERGHYLNVMDLVWMRGISI